jgi:hypothetical protein
MFVGTETEIADECARIVPGVPVLRVKYAAGAVARMLVTRPLVVVIDGTLRQVDVRRVAEGARDIGAEVVEASKAGVELPAYVRSSLLRAEQRRTRPVSSWSERPPAGVSKLTLPEGPFPLSAESIDLHVDPLRIGTYALLESVGSDGDFAAARVGRSDTDVNGRLKAYLSDPRYTADERYDLVVFFAFGYVETPESAFETECVLYHDWEPPLNEHHPGRPRGSECRCPVDAEDPCLPLEVEE